MDDVRGEFVQDFELALSVIRQTGQWMIDSGHNPSDFWKPANLTVEFVLTHAKRDEFYAYVVDGEPAAAYVAQEYDDGNSWREVARDSSYLMLHWVSVSRKFAGKGLVGEIVSHAKRAATKRGFDELRIDVNAANPKLLSLYEGLGFVFVANVDDGYRVSALYSLAVR